MSASPSPCSQSVIVTRLRAAGCVFAEDEGRLLVSAARTPADLDAMVDQRVAGAPLEHVIGWAGGGALWRPAAAGAPRGRPPPPPPRCAPPPRPAPPPPPAGSPAGPAPAS